MGAALALSLAVGHAGRRVPAMQRPAVVVFDVNETLLDLAPLKASVGDALGRRDELAALWFSTLLHYSLVDTLCGMHHSFAELGISALMFVARTHGMDVDPERAEAAVVTPLRSLPPHPEVVAALTTLSGLGYRIASLTNSSSAGAKIQLEHAGLTDLFEARFSAESVKKYKPHPDTYRMVISQLGVLPGAALMVAAHAWDLAGAKSVGMQTAFVARRGTALFPGASTPDLVVNDLSELVTCLHQCE